MTTIIFWSKRDLIAGFEMSGHTESDNVCAAVSSAAYLAANTITEIIGVKAKVRVRDGYMLLRLNQEDIADCAVILKGLRLHLEGLQLQYPNRIKVILRRCFEC